MMHGQAILDNEINLLIIYIKSVFWRVAIGLSYTEDARCLKVKLQVHYFRRYDSGKSKIAMLLCILKVSG